MISTILHIFNNVADSMGLPHYYGTRSYQYLQSIETTTDIMFIAPFKKKTEHRVTGATSDKFSFEVWFLTPSHLDEDYESVKFENHISHCEALQIEFFRRLNMSTLEWSIDVSELANVLNNMDGVAAVGTIELFENNNCQLPNPTTGTYTVCRQNSYFTVSPPNDFERGDIVIVRDTNGLEVWTGEVISVTLSTIYLTAGKTCNVEPTSYANYTIEKI